jgi:3-phenylpropionate/trans-cinnamate dioxygenase ferredoxin subunit
MNEKEYSWKRIAEHINEIPFAENNIGVIEFEGRKICVAKLNDEYYAFPYTCPHAGGILAYGFIDPQGYVVCPLHRYRFDPQNGRNVSGEGYFLKHWPLRWIEGDGVFIGY